MDPVTLDVLTALLDECRIFEAREFLLGSLSGEGLPGQDAAGILLQNLFRLDFKLRTRLLDELLARGAPYPPEILDDLRNVLEQRRSHLGRLLKLTGVGEVSIVVRPPSSAEEVAEEERRLRRALASGAEPSADATAALIESLTATEALLQILSDPDAELPEGLSLSAERRAELERELWSGAEERLAARELEALREPLVRLERLIEEEGIGGIAGLEPSEPVVEIDERGLGRGSVPPAGPGSSSDEAGTGPSADAREEATDEEAAPSPPRALRRTPHMDLDRAAPARPGDEIRVTVYADTRAERTGEESREIEIQLPDDRTTVEVEALLVASPHFEVVGSNRGRIEIRLGWDESTEARFVVRVRPEDELLALLDDDRARAGLGTLTVAFRHEGRPSGRVRRTIRIDEEGSDQREPEAMGEAEGPGDAEPPPRIAVEPGARPPDLLVEIHAEQNTDQHFVCRIETSLVAVDPEERERRWVLKRRTEELVAAMMKNFTREGVDARGRLAFLRGAGVSLFDAAPENFRSVFWRILDSGSPLESIAVVTEEAAIPWELMIPNRTLPDGTFQQTEPLGIEYALGRWVARDGCAAPQRIPLGDSLIVAPEYPPKDRLAHARDEVSFVKELMGRIERGAEEVRPAGLGEIDDTLLESSANLLHFVCHGAEREPVPRVALPDGRPVPVPSGQVIQLEHGQELDSLQIKGLRGFIRAFQDSRALVFMNACEVGRTRPALVGVGGFAKQFTDLGASAVIAPIWSVKDGIAHEVARQFYDEAVRHPEEPLARIVADVRARTYREPDAEDSFAAYCFYGDPLARLEVDEAGEPS